MAKESKTQNNELKNNNKNQKEERKSKKKNNTKNVLKTIDDKRIPIILFIVGFLISTLLFRCILWPDRIATLSDGTYPVVNLKNSTITANDLYESMKSYYSVNILLNDIDDMILSKKYKSNDEMEDKIKSTADYYYSIYESNYGYTKEEFLNQYGYSSENDFLDSLRLDYRRNKYYDEYVLSIIQIKKLKNITMMKYSEMLTQNKS